MPECFYVIIKPLIPAYDCEVGKGYNKILHRFTSFMASTLYSTTLSLVVKIAKSRGLDVGTVTLETFLTKHEADQIYKEHRGKPYHEANMKYLCSGKVKIMAVVMKERSPELRYLCRRFKKLKEIFRKHEIFKGPFMRYNIVHVPDSIERATEDLDCLHITQAANVDWAQS